MTDKAQPQDDEALHRKVEALQEQLAKLHGDMSRLVETVAQTAGTTEARIDEAAKAARSKLESEVEKATDAGKKALHEMDEVARRHPVATLALAFSVGMLISRLLDSPQKR